MKCFSLIRHRTARRSVMLLVFGWCVVFVVRTVKTTFFETKQVNDYQPTVSSSVTNEPRTRSSESQGLESTTLNADHTKLGLNLHAWHVCGLDVQMLKHWPFFPHSPDRKVFVKDFVSNFIHRDVGQRMFGFLVAPLDGKYQFAISATNASELWLSEDEGPKRVRLIVEVRNSSTGVGVDSHKQLSTEISLKAGRKYFVESLHKNGPGKGHLSVLWKPPGAKGFSVIEGQYLSPFCSEVETRTCPADKQRGADSIIPSHFKRMPPKALSEEVFRYYYHTPFFDQQYLEGVLPSILYDPSYVIKDGNVHKWQGIYIALAHHTAVHPEDPIQIERGAQITHSPRELGPNDVLPNATAVRIVKQFVKLLYRHHHRRFELEKIIGVEGKPDKAKGTRYLLELKIRDTNEKKSLRLAEYVFSDTENHLWFPKDFGWENTVMIHFIVPVKNQIKWVSFLINEMSTLYLRTRDENFRLVIVDFESTDGDVEKVLIDSPLSQKYTLVKKSGAFYKTLALQDAVKTVTDPNSIVFLFDLHITVPVALLDSIRKHTIQRRAAFLPIVARLECGTSPVNPRGRWEESGSGLVAVYKSDWDRFRGMNVEEYKTRWGGEDWDLLDRILRVGLESERLKIPGFYHYYHSKAAMWGAR